MKLLKHKKTLNGKSYEQAYINVPKEFAVPGEFKVKISDNLDVTFNLEIVDSTLNLTLKKQETKAFNLETVTDSTLNDLSPKVVPPTKDICSNYLPDLEMCFHPKIGYKKKVQCSGNDDVCDLRS